MATKKNKPPLTVSKPALLVDGEDRQFRQFVHDMLAFSARVQGVRSGLASAVGLSDAGYSILISVLHLQDSDEGVGVNRVAEHLHLSGAFVTIEVGKLVKQGLINKVVHPEDRRRVLLTVTNAARLALADLAPMQRQVNDALFDALSADDFRRLAAILGKLTTCGDQALGLLNLLMDQKLARA
jgi:DNA-binding MarR family transcriptional regulator